LPLGTAYAVWTGIGAIGTAVLGILLFGEAVTPTRLISIGLIVAGIAGLRLSATRDVEPGGEVQQVQTSD